MRPQNSGRTRGRGARHGAYWTVCIVFLLAAPTQASPWLVRGGASAAKVRAGITALSGKLGGATGPVDTAAFVSANASLLADANVLELLTAAQAGNVNLSHPFFADKELVVQLLRGRDLQVALTQQALAAGGNADELGARCTPAVGCRTVLPVVDETLRAAVATTETTRMAAVSGDVLYGSRYTPVTDLDVHLFAEGTHTRVYEKLGAHAMTVDGVQGTAFAVWAPNADEIHVKGTFNEWSADRHPLRQRGASGIWEGFVPGAQPGDQYKFGIRNGDYRVDKADPYGFLQETPGATSRNASVIADMSYEWGDADWVARRGKLDPRSEPVSFYEVHFGSWRRGAEGEQLTVHDWVNDLIAHLDLKKDTGVPFTHVEFTPITHHPLIESMGYQTTGLFAPTSQWFPDPRDFMYIVDRLHQAGYGVVIDWVPAHFPLDDHGLAYFDGTHLYEHSDSRQGFHPHWTTGIFNFGRSEVKSYLTSSAHFWIERYHVDGLRVDAVASMLYNDYGREGAMGEAWIPSTYVRPDGTTAQYPENLDAIRFLRWANTSLQDRFPGVITAAEESTSYPGVSRPVPANAEGEAFDLHGLGFTFKWDMGWMHDRLAFLAREPVHRKWHMDDWTFRYMYQDGEAFVLPLSHDEVIHGKGSIVNKMPGDDWQKFANARILYAMMYGEPGKKLLMMGQEFGQLSEWATGQSLDWHLLGQERHGGLQRLVGDLNRLYRSEPGLHLYDTEAQGFEFLTSDKDKAVVAFLRKGNNPEDTVLVVANFDSSPVQNYRVGVPEAGTWSEILNTDAGIYGGSGWGNYGGVESSPVAQHEQPQSVTLTLPPLGVAMLKLAPAVAP